MHNILLRRRTQDSHPVLHQEILADAKNKIQQTTGLCPQMKTAERPQITQSTATPQGPPEKYTPRND